jgi:hypothetical protein
MQPPDPMSGLLTLALRGLAGFAGTLAILGFFKSIIRVGVLNQRYQDPLAFWVGRVLLNLFLFHSKHFKKNDPKRNALLSWYWPCALIGIVCAWFLLVTFGFALLNWAFRANSNFTDAIVASGSALSTIGFSTPTCLAGQLLAIVEGAIGLFLVVYIFTFLPAFLQLIRDRENRVSWIYARTGPSPSGVALLRWLARNARLENLSALCEDWEKFFRSLGQSRSLLPILCVVRPIDPTESWLCAVTAFLDALALLTTTVDVPVGNANICFQLGAGAIGKVHDAMRGKQISPGSMTVSRQDYDAACELLAQEGIPLKPNREATWESFASAHRLYEQEIAWLATALGDPTPRVS